MDALGDLTSSPVHRTFPNLNLLADLVHPYGEGESSSHADDLNSMRPLPTSLSSRILDEYEENGHNPLFKTFPIMSSPTAVPQNNDSLSFFHLEMKSSDAETGSKVSSESSSSIDVHSTYHAQNNLLTYPAERTSFGVLDLCNSTEAQGGEAQPSRKRKHAGEQSKSYLASDSAKKKRKVTKPSKFCHVCVRSCDQVSMVPCVNVAVGTCRKNICRRCFQKHGIAHEWVSATQNPCLIRRIHTGALERIPDDAWACLHCRKICPSNAQCTIYQRTNRRRHESLQQRRNMRLEREREIERKMRQARNREETRQRKIVDSFIFPSEFSTLPLSVPLPPDIVPESEQYIRNGLSHAQEDTFSPLLAGSKAGSQWTS